MKSYAHLIDIALGAVAGYLTMDGHWFVALLVVAFAFLQIIKNP